MVESSLANWDGSKATKTDPNPNIVTSKNPQLIASPPTALASPKASGTLSEALRSSVEEGEAVQVRMNGTSPNATRIEPSSLHFGSPREILTSPASADISAPAWLRGHKGGLGPRTPSRTQTAPSLGFSSPLTPSSPLSSCSAEGIRPSASLPNLPSGETAKRALHPSSVSPEYSKSLGMAASSSSSYVPEDTSGERRRAAPTHVYGKPRATAAGVGGALPSGSGAGSGSGEKILNTTTIRNTARALNVNGRAHHQDSNAEAGGRDHGEGGSQVTDFNKSKMKIKEWSEAGDTDVDIYIGEDDGPPRRERVPIRTYGRQSQSSSRSVTSERLFSITPEIEHVPSQPSQSQPQPGPRELFTPPPDPRDLFSPPRDGRTHPVVWPVRSRSSSELSSTSSVESMPERATETKRKRKREVLDCVFISFPPVAQAAKRPRRAPVSLSVARGRSWNASTEERTDESSTRSRRRWHSPTLSDGVGRYRSPPSRSRSKSRNGVEGQVHSSLDAALNHAWAMNQRGMSVPVKTVVDGRGRNREKERGNEKEAKREGREKKKRKRSAEPRAPSVPDSNTQRETIRKRPRTSVAPLPASNAPVAGFQLDAEGRMLLRWDVLAADLDRQACANIAVSVYGKLLVETTEAAPRVRSGLPPFSLLPPLSSRVDGDEGDVSAGGDVRCWGPAVMDVPIKKRPGPAAAGDGPDAGAATKTLSSILGRTNQTPKPKRMLKPRAEAEASTSKQPLSVLAPPSTDAAFLVSMLPVVKTSIPSPRPISTPGPTHAAIESTPPTHELPPAPPDTTPASANSVSVSAESVDVPAPALELAPATVNSYPVPVGSPIPLVDYSSTPEGSPCVRGSPPLLSDKAQGKQRADSSKDLIPSSSRHGVTSGNIDSTWPTRRSASPHLQNGPSTPHLMSEFFNIDPSPTRGPMQTSPPHGLLFYSAALSSTQFVSPARLPDHTPAVDPLAPFFDSHQQYGDGTVDPSLLFGGIVETQVDVFSQPEEDPRLRSPSPLPSATSSSSSARSAPASPVRTSGRRPVVRYVPDYMINTDLLDSDHQSNASLSSSYSSEETTAKRKVHPKPPKRPAKTRQAKSTETKVNDSVTVSEHNADRFHRYSGPPWPHGGDFSFCHQCRRKTTYLSMQFDECIHTYCVRCIMIRYEPGSVPFGPVMSTEECPLCIGTCTCDVCTRRRGEYYVPVRPKQVPVQKSEIPQLRVPSRVVTPPPKMRYPELEGKLIEPAAYYATMYDFNGVAIARTFVGEDGDTTVLLAQRLPRRRVFIGAVQEEWGLGAKPRVFIEPTPVLATTTPMPGCERYYIGKRSVLSLPVRPRPPPVILPALNTLHPSDPLPAVDLVLTTPTPVSVSASSPPPLDPAPDLTDFGSPLSSLTDVSDQDEDKCEPDHGLAPNIVDGNDGQEPKAPAQLDCTDASPMGVELIEGDLAKSIYDSIKVVDTPTIVAL